MLTRVPAAIVLLLPSLAAALDLSAGAGVGSRRLFYRDALSPELRGYEARAFPVVTVQASAFPLRDPSFGEAGVEGRFTGAVGLSSTLADRADVPTGFGHGDAAATLRFFWGDLRPSLSAGVGACSFSLDGNRGASEGLPSYNYRYIRLGAGLELVLTRLEAGLAASYLPVLAAGALADRFRGESARGVEGEAHVLFRFTPLLATRVRFSYTHFAQSMQPLKSDPVVAGGALDQFLAATAEVVVTP